MLKSPVVALTSHEELAARLTSTMLCSHVALKFSGEGVGDRGIDASITMVVVARIATPAIEAQASWGNDRRPSDPSMSWGE